MSKMQIRWLIEMNGRVEDGKSRNFISARPLLGYTFTANPQNAMWWETRTKADAARCALLCSPYLRVTKHIFTEGD